ncbi:MAG: alpha-galactosidase, partial [Chthoniobacterales bacterium]
TGLFVWEEALIEGEYVHAYHSGMGRVSSRDKVWEKWQTGNKGFGFNRSHLRAFEVEVDGQLMQGRWVMEGESQVTTPRGGLEHTLILKDSVYPVRIAVKTLLDGTSFMERWLEIENTGDKPFRISRLFPWCGVFFQEADASFSWKSVSRPLTHEVQLARYFNSTWCEEGDFRWIDLPEGTYRHESTAIRRNSPNHYWLRDVTTGACAVINFEYSGGICVDFNRVTRPRPFEYVRARAGMAGSSPLRVVDPGEKVKSPRVHFSLLYGNEDTATNAFFDHVRKSVIPVRDPARTYPLEYQSCSYLVPKFPPLTADFFRQEVEIAATLAAEAIIVDAGWNIPKGKLYTDVFGDWEENELLDGKLNDCFDYARQRGLQAALWVPIEAISLNSKTLKEHPHWCLRDKEKDVEMLDLTQKEVAEYTYDKICHLVEKYSLDIFRIDGSTGEYLCWLRENGESVEDLTWKYYDRLYDIFDRVRLRYPNLILENCWGGGGRIDLGLMRRFDWAQITDNWHPEEQLRTFSGLSLSMPPEQCVLWVGAINMHEA